MSTTNYTQAPPPYQGSPGKVSSVSQEDEAAQPLLGSPRAGPSAGGIYDQPAFGDVPDDFKVRSLGTPLANISYSVQYGTSVYDSSPEIRQAFVRKVYTILYRGSISQSQSTIVWVQEHTWSFYVPLFGTLVNLGLLYWKRHSHPINLVLLSTFTALEAFALGVMVAFFDNILVLQALLITLGVFLGLTLFTFQSKYDFSGFGPWLFGGLIAIMMTGFVAMFLPFNRTFDLVMAICGCLLFSGYIVYDTYIITKRLSPDEYIMAAISLYLDFINLFINILRVLNDVQER